MNKQMQDVRVRTEGGVVYIEQASLEDMNDTSIMLNPEQIDVLIQWLNEALSEHVLMEALDGGE